MQGFSYFLTFSLRVVSVHNKAALNLMKLQFVKDKALRKLSASSLLLNLANYAIGYPT